MDKSVTCYGRGCGGFLEGLIARLDGYRMIVYATAMLGRDRDCKEKSKCTLGYAIYDNESNLLLLLLCTSSLAHPKCPLLTT